MVIDVNNKTFNGRRVLEPLLDGSKVNLYDTTGELNFKANVVLGDNKTYSDLKNCHIIICNEKQQILWEKNEDLTEIIENGAKVISIAELLAKYIFLDSETCNPIVLSCNR